MYLTSQFTGPVPGGVLLEANAVPYVCKIDIDLYRCAAKDICSDEVIVTEKQIEHICRRHGGDYGRYAKYFAEVLQRPDYILADNKPNTAVVLKKPGWAEPVTVPYQAWNSSKVTDAGYQTAERVESDSTDVEGNDLSWENSWYVVSTNVIIKGRLATHWGRHDHGYHLLYPISLTLLLRLSQIPTLSPA